MLISSYIFFLESENNNKFDSIETGRLVIEDCCYTINKRRY